MRLYLYFIKRQNIISYFKIKSQIKRGKKVRLLIGYEGKKPGWFSLGFDKQNDVYIKTLKKIKICIPDNCVSEIYIDDFLRKLNNGQLFSLLSECFRVLMPSGLVKIKSLDAQKAINKFIDDPSYFSNEQFWNKRINVGTITPLDILGDLLFQESSQRLFNAETILSVLKKFNFEIKEVNDITEELFTVLILRKCYSTSSRISTRLPKIGEIKRDIPIYLYNCDSLSILEKLKRIQLHKLQGRRFASVIGSMFFINLLSYLRPKEIYLFDINQYQVRYMKVFVDILKYSEDFNEFLENFFSRKFQKDISKFLKSSSDNNIYEKNFKRIVDKEIFELTFGKIAHGEYVLLDNVYPALKISDNSMCQHILMMHKELFIPGPEANVVFLQDGLANHFDYIKKLLKDATIEVGTLQDKKTVNFMQQDNGFLYVSNIGEDDWLYGDFMDQDLETIKFQSWLLRFSEAFKKQMIESFIGFHNFIKKIENNFWIIDSSGNIFNSQELLKERSDSHAWLWQKIEPLIIGDKIIELIHLKKGEWGFKEYLQTMNVNDYLDKHNDERFTTIIFHMLLSNEIGVGVFIKTLKKASQNCRRIIVFEHDKDSINFGNYSGKNIIDIRILLRILRSVPEVEKGEIKIYWSGASHRVDEKIYGNKANFNRNFIITVDL